MTTPDEIQAARAAVEAVREVIEAALNYIEVAPVIDGEQPFHDPGYALGAALAQLEDVPKPDAAIYRVVDE